MAEHHQRQPVLADQRFTSRRRRPRSPRDGAVRRGRREGTVQLPRLHRGVFGVDRKADLEFLHDAEQRDERAGRRHLVYAGSRHQAWAPLRRDRAEPREPERTAGGLPPGHPLQDGQAGVVTSVQPPRRLQHRRLHGEGRRCGRLAEPLDREGKGARRRRKQERHLLRHEPPERPSGLGGASRSGEHLRRCPRLGCRRRRPDHCLLEHRRPVLQRHDEHFSGRCTRCRDGPRGLDPPLRGQRLRTRQRRHWLGLRRHRQGHDDGARRLEREDTVVLSRSRQGRRGTVDCRRPGPLGLWVYAVQRFGSGWCHQLRGAARPDTCNTSAAGPCRPARRAGRKPP